MSDLVSFDVVDAASGIPALTSADPPDQRVGVDPLAKVEVRLQDRSSAVNTNSIRLSFDETQVTPVIQKSGTNTVVSYSAGLLAPLSAHTYQIIFGDTHLAQRRPNKHVSVYCR